MLKKFFVVAIMGCVAFTLSFFIGKISVDYNESQNPKTVERVIPREYNLLSASIETKNISDLDEDTKVAKFFCYTFETSSKEKIHKEKQIHNKYEGNYELKFEVGEENKILQYDYKSKTLLVFVMTKEMHENVFREK